jgi:hypothetical protein
MGGKSTIGRPLTACPARARVIAGPRPNTEWYTALFIAAGFFVLATLGFLSARAFGDPTASYTANAESSAELYTGTVISYPDSKRECREQLFDNKTGKMTKSEPCGLRALSGTGAPAPSSSIGLAIKKTFSNR